MAQFRVLAQHLDRGAEKMYEECEDSRCPDLAANQEHPLNYKLSQSDR